MKKLAALGAILLLAASFGSSAYILTGTDADQPEDAVKHCATAKNYWVCIENYKRFNK
ncbi:hypothetical protein C942_01716 [Photobacterium marinum]|uniref:Uncharacterized protein n=1 Tax=Photobacterium marinum TaxID=1056511 RepID=L8JC81_9GAMM|nr:hypothetical protein [Photobacterium marinum]ELR65144.1 hypothetical protein C942_01716 [Photobacterium marinum]